MHLQLSTAAMTFYTESSVVKDNDLKYNRRARNRTCPKSRPLSSGEWGRLGRVIQGKFKGDLPNAGFSRIICRSLQCSPETSELRCFAPLAELTYIAFVFSDERNERTARYGALSEKGISKFSTRRRTGYTVYRAYRPAYFAARLPRLRMFRNFPAE